MAFNVKRVYEPAAATDGTRVLVDRLWPRGRKKSDAKIDLWMKEIAPSTPLRHWFGHDPQRFPEFKRRYASEIKRNPALSELRQLGKSKTVSLLYGARDPEVNHAVVLLAALRGGARRRGPMLSR
jgi:uncharacterized protein YeaO (DUF488 family)